MKLFPAFVAVCAVMLPSTVWAADDKPDCHLRVVARLDMRTLPDGRITIPATVEGHEYPLLVDTGGYANTLSNYVVQREGYERKEAWGAEIGMGKSKLEKYVTVKKFALGHAGAEGFKFYIDDFDLPGTQGTLAPEVLAAYDADFDFAHEKFNLIAKDHCPGQVVYWTDSPAAVIPFRMPDFAHIVAKVQVDGKDIDAWLDTGAQATYITMKAAKEYLDLDDKSPQLKSLGNKNINGMVGEVFYYPFATLNLGGLTVNHPRIFVLEDKMWTEQNLLLLGQSTLRQLHMYIAYKEKKLYVTPAMAGR